MLFLIHFDTQLHVADCFRHLEIDQLDGRLMFHRYIEEPPASAYESGGMYQYVLVDVEHKPTVKLVDLQMAEAIRDMTCLKPDF
jgi:hypothetical protein